MAESLLHDLRVHSILKLLSGAPVPEVMEADAAYAGALEQRSP